MRLTVFLVSIAVMLLKVTAEQPNVIIVFADDMGFDIGPFGVPTIPTPNFDRMAQEGAKFTQWYSGENICSPSRAALLTGRYAIRSGIYSNESDPAPNTGDHRVIHPNCCGALLDSEILLPEQLRTLGYTTGMIGKWHLGYAHGNVSMLPIGRGFDHVLGTPATHCESGGNFPDEQLFNGSEIIGHLNLDINVNDLTINYTNFAVDFIKSSVADKKPFFLYAAFDSTHSNVYSSARWQGYTSRGPYGDAVAELDWAVGELMGTVEDLGVKDNTIIVYTSDNGAWSILSTAQGALPGDFTGQWAMNPMYAHLNGNNTYVDTGKGSTWEGGHRVPALAWGGPVAAGVREEMVSTLDLYPTIVDLAGGSLAKDRAYDGASFRSLLETGAQSPPARDTFFYYATHVKGAPANRINAVRIGKYKVHYYTKSGFGDDPFVAHDPPLVFDVEQDNQERLPVEATAAILQQAAEALKTHEATMTFGAPQLDLVSYKCMSCSGLPASLSGCCQTNGGKCAVKSDF